MTGNVDVQYTVEMLPAIGVGFGAIGEHAVNEMEMQECADVLTTHCMESTVGKEWMIVCFDGRTLLVTLEGITELPEGIEIPEDADVEQLMQIAEAVRAAEVTTGEDGFVKLHMAGGIMTPLLGAVLAGKYADIPDSTEAFKHVAAAELTTMERIPGAPYLGGHVDSNHKDIAELLQGDCGCGACDKARMAVAVLADPQFRDVISGTTQAFLGEAYSENSMQVSYGNAQTVMQKGMLDNWKGGNYMEIMQNAGRRDTDWKHRVEVLIADRNDHKTYGHREGFLAAVYREDVAINRDEFARRTGKQVFPLEVPALIKMSELMASGVENTAELASNLLHAFVAYQIVVAIVLTNGNVPVLTIR